MTKCCVITRAFYEDAYLNFFIEYYIKLGFEHIFICKSDNIVFSQNNYKDKVTIFYDNNDIPGNKSTFNGESFKGYGIIANPVDDKIPILKNSEYDWVLNVDNDELLYLENGNIKDFLNKNISDDINIIHFRWGMISRKDNFYLGFNETLQVYPIHSNLCFKSMSKIKDLVSLSHHNSLVMNRKAYPIEISHNNTMEDTYETTTALNYNNFILHVCCRSINNAFIKTFTYKGIDANGSNLTFSEENKIKLKDYVNNFSFDKDHKILFDELKKFIGKKFLSMINECHKRIEKKNLSNNFNLINDFCDKELEINLLKKLLKKNNIPDTLIDILNSMDLNNLIFCPTKKDQIQCLENFIKLNQLPWILTIPNDFDINTYKRINKLDSKSNYEALLDWIEHRHWKKYKVNSLYYGVYINQWFDSPYNCLNTKKTGIKNNIEFMSKKEAEEYIKNIAS